MHHLVFHPVYKIELILFAIISGYAGFFYVDLAILTKTVCCWDV